MSLFSNVLANVIGSYKRENGIEMASLGRNSILTIDENRVV